MSLSYVYSKFSRSYIGSNDIIAVMANGMFTGVVLCFKFFSALISYINVDITYKTKLFGIIQ